MFERTRSRGDKSLHPRGAAQQDCTIAISLSIIVFMTARSWVIPVARWAVPSLGHWLAGLPEAAKFITCGCLALLIVSGLVASAIRLTDNS